MFYFCTPVFYFCTHWKRQKIKGFFTFFTGLMGNGLNVVNMNAMLSASFYYQYKNGAIKLPKAILCLPSLSLSLSLSFFSSLWYLKRWKDYIQILLLILSEARINFFTAPWNHQKIYGFVMISGGIEVNYFS